MRSSLRFATVACLAVAIGSFFLPWFAWSGHASIDWDRGFLGRFPTDPPYSPIDRYEVQLGVPPAGAVLDFEWETTGERRAGPYDDSAYREVDIVHAVPLMYLSVTKPYCGSACRVAWGAMALLAIFALTAALRTTRRRRVLAALLAVGAFAAAIAGALLFPDFAKYLANESISDSGSAPQYWRIDYSIHYSLTPWFWLGMGSLLLGAVAASLAGSRADRNPEPAGLPSPR
jgi:hypothetical protein